MCCLCAVGAAGECGEAARAPGAATTTLHPHQLHALHKELHRLYPHTTQQLHLLHMHYTAVAHITMGVVFQRALYGMVGSFEQLKMSQVAECCLPVSACCLPVSASAVGPLLTDWLTVVAAGRYLHALGAMVHDATEPSIQVKRCLCTVHLHCASPQCLYTVQRVLLHSTPIVPLRSASPQYSCTVLVHSTPIVPLRSASPQYSCTVLLHSTPALLHCTPAQYSFTVLLHSCTVLLHSTLSQYSCTPAQYSCTVLFHSTPALYSCTVLFHSTPTVSLHCASTWIAPRGSSLTALLAVWPSCTAMRAIERLARWRTGSHNGGEQAPKARLSEQPAGLPGQWLVGLL